MSNIIVMAFSPRNIVGCLLKKGLQRGGHGHPRTPPRYALVLHGDIGRKREYCNDHPSFEQLLILGKLQTTSCSYSAKCSESFLIPLLEETTYISIISIPTLI